MQRSRTVIRLFSALLLLSTGLALGSGTALVFTIDEVFNELQRWSNEQGSLKTGYEALAEGLSIASLTIRNYDTDDYPTNVIPIDCEDPTKGLRVSRNIDPNAVMNNPVKRGLVKLGLTNDDIGGRNFLYPICPSAASAQRDGVGVGLLLGILSWGVVGLGQRYRHQPHTLRLCRPCP